MFQIDDLDAEIKRIDHLSAMEIRKIMHTNIDTMGTFFSSLFLPWIIIFESAVELNRTGQYIR